MISSETAVAAVTKQDKIAEGAAYWASFYRANPWRFVRDYLHVNLKLFQKILLTMMMLSSTFAFIAARGIGKTYLSAIYATVRCILYPGTKCCVASGVRSQGVAVIDKIRLELIPNSPELEAEIESIRINGTICEIIFKNSSFIRVVTAGDSSRGNRANVLLLDECRLINPNTIDVVLRKFLTQRRMPRYSELTQEEREKEYDKEKNIIMYLTSAYWQDSWVFNKCRDIFVNMLDETKHQFVCGFPYQLSIAEGLLDKGLLEDEMAESDFNEVKFSMEYCAEFYGSSDGSFFDFGSISKNRKIKYPMYPDRMSSKLSSNQIRITPKQNGEVRILSADIALMSSKRNHNDATAIFINQMMPTKAGRYTSNIVYADASEGLHTEDQALMIRRLYDEYQCDYIVLDTNGIGLGVFDCLVRDIVDSDSGEVYPALSCCNDKSMADRCSSPNADKVIFSIKASAQLNSDCAVLLREGFKSGKIRLLADDYDADELLGEIKGYQQMNPAEKVRYKEPYIHTTLLINELINLRHDETGGKVRIFEKTGMRKDRYSSLSYNYYVALQLENKMVKRHSNSVNSDLFIIKPPSFSGKAVSEISGRNKHPTWF